MLSVNTELFWILVGMTAATLMQAFVLLGILLTMRKAVRTVKEQADEYRGKLTPVIESSSQLISTGKDLVAVTKALVDNLKPELETAATELANMTREIRDQVDRLQSSVDDVVQKAHSQADRMNGMTTSFLNGVDRFGTFLNEAVHAPIRQVNGFVAAARAVVETLRSPAPARPRGAAQGPQPASQAVRSEDDKDLFV
jgi:hypothetical protein